MVIVTLTGEERPLQYSTGENLKFLLQIIGRSLVEVRWSFVRHAMGNEAWDCNIEAKQVG